MQVPLAAILSGGKATRMGCDKALLEIQGVPLIERVWRNAAPLAGRVVVVGGGSYLEHRGVPTVPDRFPGAGALGGVGTALAHAGEALGPGAWVLVLACDMPFVQAGLIRLLWARREGVRIVVPRTSLGYEPLCALYRADVAGVVEDQIRQGDLRLSTVFRRVSTRAVPEPELRAVDPGLRSFLNLNRPDDVERVRQLLLRAGACGASAPGSARPGAASCGAGGRSCRRSG